MDPFHDRSTFLLLVPLVFGSSSPTINPIINVGIWTQDRGFFMTRSRSHFLLLYIIALYFLHPAFYKRPFGALALYWHYCTQQSLSPSFVVISQTLIKLSYLRMISEVLCKKDFTLTFTIYPYRFLYKTNTWTQSLQPYNVLTSMGGFHVLIFRSWECNYNLLAHPIDCFAK
jgi:hypothetical protein